MLKEVIRPFQYPRNRAVEGNSIQNNSVSKKKPKVKNGWGTLKRIWMYLTYSKGKLSIVLLMVVLSSSMALLGPFMVGKAIDRYIIDLQSNGILFTLLWLAGVYVTHSVSIWIQNTVMIEVAQRTVYKMRTELFRHLHQLPISYFDKQRHGELMSRATNDMENVSNTLNSSFIQIVTSILTLIGTLTVMLYLSPLLTLLTMLVIPLMVFGMKWITKRTGKLFKEQQKNLGDINGFIEETLSGQKIIKTFSLEKKVLGEFREKNQRLKGSGFWAQTFSGFIPKLMNGLNNLSFAVIAGIGGILAINQVITIGVIVIFAEYSRQFTRPLNDLANQFNTFLSAIAGAERVFNVLDEEEELQDEHNAVELVEVKGGIDFSHVSFSYEKDNNTIFDVSFQAAQGQTVALVGPTGAGKTTIINLLTRFYEADDGEILIDGHDISTIKRDSLRRHMAFVLQDSYLFQGTIRENIRYGRLDASDEEVEEAAKQANAHTFITKLNEKYNTVLKHEGSGISQGQKQLISIARAILANPTILILDEATSSIDTITEIHIQDALQQLMKGRTSFVIAHRLNTIQNADQILVVKEGRIVERGLHEQLLQQKGYYNELMGNSPV
jgi:ATP-binding cassette subfamily B multidrug efflux pump